MLKYLKRYGYALFMGFALSALFDAHLTDWKYWVFVVCMVVLVVIREEK